MYKNFTDTSSALCESTSSALCESKVVKSGRILQDLSNYIFVCNPTPIRENLRHIFSILRLNNLKDTTRSPLDRRRRMCNHRSECTVFRNTAWI